MVSAKLTGVECACEKVLESLKLFENIKFYARIPHPTSLALGHLLPGRRHWVGTISNCSINGDLKKLGTIPGAIKMRDEY